MKFKRGDRVALLCIKNVYGVDFQCYLGELVGVRKLWGKPVFKIKAARLLLIQGETDMEGAELEVSGQAFDVYHFDAPTKNKIRELRTSCQELQLRIHSLLKSKTST